MTKLRKVLVAVIPLALLAACATPSKPQPTAPEAAAAERGAADVETRAAPETGGLSGERLAAESAGTAAVDELHDPASLLSKRVVYFDFDKSDIKSEFRPIIRAHAEYLARNRGVRVVLEGHADERGSREYNIGLGERRANSVRGFLTLQGAATNQIETVSYGEERPVAMGHDEASWRLNRRVEIVYQ